MATVGFASDRLFLEHQSPGHPERPERLRAILDQLARTGIRQRMVEVRPRDATEDEVLAVHSPDLLPGLRSLAAAGGGWVDPDTYVNPASPAVALRSAGAVLSAVEAVMSGRVERAFAAVRPPGHHATRETAMGFCLLNNVAMAVAAARSHGAARIAVVDWDVHHGNGTQAIFDGDGDILYISTHAAPFYPGTGAIRDSGRGAARGTKVNIPLPYGTGDAGYAAAFDAVVIPALRRFAPHLIVVSSGWDAHARDPIGPMQLTTAGYTALAARVRDAAGPLCGGRLVATLEGGYDGHALAWCSSALCEVLLDAPPTPDPEPVATGSEPNIEQVIEAVRDEIALR